MVFLIYLSVNRRDRLVGLPPPASAQPLECLGLGQKPPLLNWKRYPAPAFKKTINLWAMAKRADRLMPSVDTPSNGIILMIFVQNVNGFTFAGLIGQVIFFRP
jgi:hypothetical protein